MSEDFPVPKVSEDAAVVLDKNQNTSKAPVKRLSAMSVREFYGRYAEPLQMTLVGSESGFDRRIIEPAESARSGSSRFLYLLCRAAYPGHWKC